MKKELIANSDDKPPQSRRSSLSIIFCLQMLTSVAYSFIFSLLTLYLLSTFHEPLTKVYALVAAYNALCYATSIFASYIAKRYIGYNAALILSLILGAIGLGFIAIPQSVALHLGLACYSLSYGMLIPTIFVVVGKIDLPGSVAKRDGSFILAYLAMDAGTVIAAFSSGYLSRLLSYEAIFLIGMATQIISLIIFLYYKKRLPIEHQRPTSPLHGLTLVLIFIGILFFLLDEAALCNFLLILAGIGCVGYVLMLASKESPENKGKLLSFLIFLGVSMLFDTSYFLYPSALTVFTDSSVNKNVLGFSIPTASFSAFNPLFVISLGVLMNWLGQFLEKKNKMPSMPRRFAVGITLMGVSYLVLMFGIKQAFSHDAINAGWLIGAIFLQTVGELFISPASYSMVGLLVPASIESIMMGISQFSSGVAGAISGYLSNLISPPSHMIKDLTMLWYQHAFEYTALFVLSVAAILYFLSPAIERLSNPGVIEVKSTNLDLSLLN